ncbi:tripartite tricarboxylate transporter TctB family protein [Limimaricola pyoseonensis]|uniref:Tripartite tricarboxylate transporter TctB family protein n=1 Tax=Limimaricola pyoseonensis TaxID=521013 RepID=A0A1G6ZYS6_9RHOB|nr:tripartite tricarboxylate transporter TctB family protein [Limimaricola pyoseonensis]SDE07533.1 Tripartite tricarboxylate transporter TctB family protein [Limimaricola pyoseonensis]
MNNRQTQTRLGLGAVIFSLLLAGLAIPRWVSSPSNVPNIVLSPLFWPYVLAGLTGLTGLGLLASRAFQDDDPTPINPPIDDPRRGALRLAGMALLMVVAMGLMSWLGMVWTCMGLLLATALLVRTRHPRAAMICAVAAPLLLYAFFAHVAGVAIPQGQLVRLP